MTAGKTQRERSRSSDSWSPEGSTADLGAPGLAIPFLDVQVGPGFHEDVDGFGFALSLDSLAPFSRKEVHLLRDAAARQK